MYNNNNDLPVRKPNRLPRYDYSQTGTYFVTLCAKDKRELFSQIIVGDGHARPVTMPKHPGDQPGAVGDGLARPGVQLGIRVNNYVEILLTNIGYEINNSIDYANKRYDDCKIVNFVIMPNHVHLLIQIEGHASTTAGRACPSPTVGNIVGGIKSGVSRNIGYSPWQRSFHDHIIRNDNDYDRIVEYIQNNPLLWKDDCFYPK